MLFRNFCLSKMKEACPTNGLKRALLIPNECFRARPSGRPRTLSFELKLPDSCRTAAEAANLLFAYLTSVFVILLTADQCNRHAPRTLMNRRMGPEGYGPCQRVASRLPKCECPILRCRAWLLEGRCRPWISRFPLAAHSWLTVLGSPFRLWDAIFLTPLRRGCNDSFCVILEIPPHLRRLHPYVFASNSRSPVGAPIPNNEVGPGPNLAN